MNERMIDYNCLQSRECQAHVEAELKDVKEQLEGTRTFDDLCYYTLPGCYP